MTTFANTPVMSQEELDQLKALTRSSTLFKPKTKPNYARSLSQGVPSVYSLIAKHIDLPSVLCSLAAQGDVVNLRRHLDSGKVDVNAADYDKRTALHLAASEGHLDCVKLLIERQANVNLIDRFSTTPLRSAVISDHKEIEALLRASGALLRTEQINTSSQAPARKNRTKLNRHKRKQQARVDLVQKLFYNLSKDKATLSKHNFSVYLKEFGIFLKKHPLLTKIPALFGETKEIDLEAFKHLLLDYNPTSRFLYKALSKKLIIPKWKSFCDGLIQIFEEVKKNTSGEIDSSLPNSESVDENAFVISIVTVDGQIFRYGDVNVDFTIESCGKALLYSMAIEDHGYEHVHKYVGKEPSGQTSNAFSVNYQSKAHNACIDAGAIAVSALFHPELERAQKFKLMNERISAYAAYEKVGFNQSTYLSLKDRAHSSFALSYYLASTGGFPATSIGVSDALDWFHQVSSLEITCDKLAIIASTFAAYGVCPLTEKRAMTFESVKRTMQLLFSCGMYHYSGEWACTVGLPAISSRTGAIMAVVPGVLGLAVYSPRLDRHGNSVRGVEFAQQASKANSWNVFDVVYQMNSCQQ